MKLASNPDVSVEFTKTQHNTALKLTATSNGEIAVSRQPAFTGNLAKQYTGAVQIVITHASLPNGKLVLPVKGILTVKVNNGPPKLAAASIAVNSFYNNAYNMNPVISITGGPVLAVRMSRITNQDNSNKKLLKAGWFTTHTDANGVFIDPTAPSLAMTPGITARRNGTLYLEARLEGWGGADEYWAPVAVKVSRNHAAPAVKLRASKVGIYTGADNQGAPVSLVPKNKKNTLAGLGVTALATAPREKKYTFAPSDEDATTGILKPKENERPVKGEKIYLEAIVAGTSNTVPLTLTVSSVATTKTKVTLKPDRSTVTLNPLPYVGETIQVKLAPNISGYSLAGKLNLKNITVIPLRAPPRRINPPSPSLPAPTATPSVSPYPQTPPRAKATGCRWRCRGPTAPPTTSHAPPWPPSR